MAVPPGAERAAALRRYGLLDAPVDPDLVSLVRAAAHMFRTSYAAINLLDTELQYTVAGIGAPTGWGMPARQSLCHLVVDSGEVLYASDLAADPVLAAYPAHRQMGFRFYLGAPLTTPDGHTIGSLCVADAHPHHLDAEQELVLGELAQVAMSLVHARRSVHRWARVAAEPT